MRFISVVALLLLLTTCLALPAGAIKIYLNPSDQTANFSPDNTYCEAVGMKDVARRLAAKLSARGFEVQNSDGGTMSQATTAANAWPADIFISMHSNAGAGPSWGKAHGTNTLYYQSRDGSPPNSISIELATRCDQKCVEKFTTYDRGYNFRITADLPFLGYPLYVLRKTNMPGTLVEGLFHDNMEDVAVLKTEEGRDAYAQGVYEALCDHFGWSYYADAPILDPAGPAANDSTGCLGFVARATGSQVLACEQTGISGAWSGAWIDLKGPMTGNAAIGGSASGRLDVFAIGSGSRLWHKVQASPGSYAFNGWYDLGGKAAGDPVVGKNADGRLDVFAIGLDKHIRHRVQQSAKSSLAWDRWYDLGGTAVGKIAVAGNADGRLAVFSRDSAGVLWYEVQHAANGLKYDGWSKLAENVSGDPVPIKDGSDRIAVFTCGMDSHVLYRTQSAPNSPKWDAWQDLGGTFVGTPAVSINTDGRLEVFARDAQGALSHNSQTAPGSTTWSGWQPITGQISGDPMVARNKDGRIEVFARSTDGRMRYRVQREPAKSAVWDGWYTLGDADPHF